LVREMGWSTRHPQLSGFRFFAVDAAPQPADCDLRIGPCVALLGEVFQVLADTGLPHIEFRDRT
jgi:hypothetical protein